MLRGMRRIRKPRLYHICCASVIPFYNLLLQVCRAKMFLWFRTGFSTGGNLLRNPVVLEGFEALRMKWHLCVRHCVCVGGRALSLLSS